MKRENNCENSGALKSLPVDHQNGGGGACKADTRAKIGVI